jgi:hypothetical protein
MLQRQSQSFTMYWYLARRTDQNVYKQGNPVGNPKKQQQIDPMKGFFFAPFYLGLSYSITIKIFKKYQIGKNSPTPYCNKKKMGLSNVSSISNSS